MYNGKHLAIIKTLGEALWQYTLKPTVYNECMKLILMYWFETWGFTKYFSEFQVEIRDFRF